MREVKNERIQGFSINMWTILTPIKNRTWRSCSPPLNCTIRIATLQNIPATFILRTQFRTIFKQISCDTIPVGIVSLHKVVKQAACFLIRCFNTIMRWTHKRRARCTYFFCLIYKWKQTHFHMFYNFMLQRIKIHSCWLGACWWILHEGSAAALRHSADSILMLVRRAQNWHGKMWMCCITRRLNWVFIIKRQNDSKLGHSTSPTIATAHHHHLPTFIRSPNMVENHSQSTFLTYYFIETMVISN